MELIGNLSSQLAAHLWPHMCWGNLRIIPLKINKLAMH